MKQYLEYNTQGYKKMTKELIEIKKKTCVASNNVYQGSRCESHAVVRKQQKL